MAVKKCEHEIDESTIEYDPRYGRKGVCKKCGAKLVQYKRARVKHGKVHMSKKERLRRRRAEKEGKV